MLYWLPGCENVELSSLLPYLDTISYISGGSEYSIVRKPFFSGKSSLLKESLNEPPGSNEADT